eukprot:8086880-Karenia_brevis.AAC.1
MVQAALGTNVKSRADKLEEQGLSANPRRQLKGAQAKVQSSVGEARAHAVSELRRLKRALKRQSGKKRLADISLAVKKCHRCPLSLE